MKTTHLFQAFLLFIVISPAAHALDLIEALSRAEEYDAVLQTALADYKTAQEASPLSMSALLPAVSFDAYTRENSTDVTYTGLPTESTNYGSNGYSLTLNQVIYNQQLLDTLDASDAQVAQATANYETARQDLIVRLTTAYFRVLGAQDNLRFTRAEEESVARQLEQSKERFNVGLIAITDVHESQARYDSAVAQRILAENALDNSIEALRVVVGDPIGELKPLREEFPLQSPEPENIDQWQQKALSENLALRAAMSGLQAARDAYDSSKAGHYPTVNLNARYGSDSSDGSSFGSAIGGRDTEDTSITLSLNLPIYEGGFTSAQSRQSASAVESAQAKVDQQRRLTVQQIRTAYLAVKSSISTVKAFKQALISARTALEATQAGFDAGTRTSVDVLVVEGSLYNSERDYARARYDYLLSGLELKRAAGSLSALDIKNINQWLTQ